MGLNEGILDNVHIYMESNFQHLHMVESHGQTSISKHFHAGLSLTFNVGGEIKKK